MYFSFLFFFQTDACSVKKNNVEALSHNQSNSPAKDVEIIHKSMFMFTILHNLVKSRDHQYEEKLN